MQPALLSRLSGPLDAASMPINQTIPSPLAFRQMVLIDWAVPKLRAQPKENKRTGDGKAEPFRTSGGKATSFCGIINSTSCRSETNGSIRDLAAVS